MKKALFIVGGPGSGKAAYIKELFQYIPHLEYKPEQLKVSITESFIIVTCNAYKLDEIKESYSMLQRIGYDSSCLFVDVDYEVALDRLATRNISEIVFVDRFNKSKQNIKQCSRLFEHFVSTENNSSITKDTLKNLSEFLMKFLFSENKKIKRKKIPTKIRLDRTQVIPSDRIGPEFSMRNSGIGYPSTVGPFYEDFSSEYSETLPALSSIERTIVPMEKYSTYGTDSKKTKSRIKKIKQVVKDANK